MEEISGEQEVGNSRQLFGETIGSENEPSLPIGKLGEVGDKYIFITRTEEKGEDTGTYNTQQ